MSLRRPAIKFAVLHKRWPVPFNASVCFGYRLRIHQSPQAFALGLRAMQSWAAREMLTLSWRAEETI